MSSVQMQSRLAALEKQNRILKLLALLVGCLVLVVLLGNVLRTPQAIAATTGAQAGVPKSVEAESFVIRSPDGAIRAQVGPLAGEGGGYGLTICDRKGGARLVLGLQGNEDSAGLMLTNGVRIATLGVGGDQGVLLFANPDGTTSCLMGTGPKKGGPVMSMYDSKNTMRVAFGLGDGGNQPNYQLMDSTGATFWSTPRNPR